MEQQYPEAKNQMIKGINKQVVIVKCGGDIFEQAIFILKPQKYADGKAITDEAERIIKEKTSYMKEKKSKKRKNVIRHNIIERLFEDY